MNDDAQAVCETCLRGSYDGTLNFPQQLGMLAGVNVEGYLVDLRTAKQTYYLHSGDTITLDAEKSGDAIAPAFAAAGVESAVRQSQAGEHTYRDFLRKVKAAGAAPIWFRCWADAPSILAGPAKLTSSIFRSEHGLRHESQSHLLHFFSAGRVHSKTQEFL